jgi:hypothetical protein
MEARFLRAALFVAAAVLSLGAGRPYHSIRSQHFIVSAPTPQLAEEICVAAETFRRDLAIEWLGRELPPWQTPCPIRADVATNLGAGGATSFVFHGGMPGQWTMQIQGSRERVLDSVLPHEITHTIFATHFGRPLPRWADEGACTTVEHPSEKAKQEKFLIQFMTPDARGNTRSIPFNRMFKMKDYPPDILPLYSQGYSLARYFIQQGGKRKYVDYVGEGMRTGNWPAATQKYYGFADLSELQLTWMEWVRRGSPDLPQGNAPQTLVAASHQAAATLPTGNVTNTQLASLAQQPQQRSAELTPVSWQSVAAQNDRSFASADQLEMPPPVPASFARPAVTPALETPASSTASRPVSDGWYAKRRDEAQAAIGSPHFDKQQESDSRKQTPADGQRAPIQAEPAAMSGSERATPAATDRSVLLEWKRPADQPYRPRDEMRGVAIREPAKLY